MSISPRTTEILEKSFTITDSLRTIDRVEDFFTQGKTFVLSRRVTVPGSGTNGGEVDIVFDPTAYSGDDHIGIFPPAINGEGNQPIRKCWNN